MATISYYSEGVAVPPFLRREVNRWIEAVAESYGYKVGGLAYQFCNNEKILEVNQKYLSHDYYTDIITFEQSVEEGLLFADIIISTEMVEMNAKEYGCTREEELFRVMIHGVLHLCGLDDGTEEEARAMRVAEERALAMLPTDRSQMWRKGYELGRE